MVFYVVMILLGDLNKITEHFFQIKIEFIIPILVIETISLIIRAFRQQKLLHWIGIQIPFFANLKIYLAAMSMVVTPGGSGEVIKSHFLKRNYGESISKTVPIVFVERYHDLLAVTTIISFSLFFLFMWQVATLAVLLILILSIVYFIVRNKNLLLSIQQKLTKIRFIRRIVPESKFNETIDKLSRPKIMLSSWIISIVSWIIDSFAVYLAFLSFEQDFSFIQVSQFYLTSLAFGAISLIPGGVGITEGSLVGFLLLEGLDISLASALVLFLRMSTIWFATFVGFFSTHLVFKQNK